MLLKGFSSLLMHYTIPAAPQGKVGIFSFHIVGHVHSNPKYLAQNFSVNL